MSEQAINIEDDAGDLSIGADIVREAIAANNGNGAQTIAAPLVDKKPVDIPEQRPVNEQAKPVVNDKPTKSQKSDADKEKISGLVGMAEAMAKAFGSADGEVSKPEPDVKAEEFKAAPEVPDTDQEKLLSSVDTQPKKWAREQIKSLLPFKAKSIELEKEVLQLRAENEKIKKSGSAEEPEIKVRLTTLQEERDLLAKQNQEMTGVIEQIRLEASPRFRQQVIEPMNQVRKEIEDILGESFSDKKDEVLSALKVEDQKQRTAALRVALSDVTGFDGSTVVTKVQDFLRLDKLRRDMIGDPSIGLQTLHEQETKYKAALQDKFNNENRQALDEVWKTMQDKIPILAPLDGNDEHNKGLETIRQAATEVMFGNLKPNQMARASLQAAAMPAVLKNFEQYWRESQAEIANYKKQVKELTASSPLIRTGVSRVTEKGDDMDDEQFGKDLLQKFG